MTRTALALAAALTLAAPATSAASERPLFAPAPVEPATVTERPLFVAAPVEPATAASPVLVAPAPSPPSGQAPVELVFPKAACPPARRAPSSAPRTPPTDRLLDAFPILRRERAPGDALPADALATLKAHGLVPVDPASARLLATTPAGGRTWLVPVPDVSRATPFPFPCVLTPGPPPRRRGRATPPPPRPAPRPALPAPTLRAPAPLDTRPREGVAVVATGDGPLPAAGALDDLERGRAALAVDGCAGPDRTMLAIHGLVPAGVREAFLTQPDGTAIRADARDGLISFVVPRFDGAGPRYVVWTGADGTPHVQPVPFVAAPRRATKRPCPPFRGRGVRVAPLGPLCSPLPFPRPTGRRALLPAPVCLAMPR